MHQKIQHYLKVTHKWANPNTYRVEEGEEGGGDLRADKAVSEMMFRNSLTSQPSCVSPKQTKIRIIAHMNLPCGWCQLNEYTAIKRRATTWAPADKTFCSPAEKQELQTQTCWEHNAAACSRSQAPRAAVWKEIFALNFWQCLQWYCQV